MAKVLDVLRRIVYWEDIYWDIVRRTPLKPKSDFPAKLHRDYKFIEAKRKTISIDEVSVMYNPDNFTHYKSLHNGGEEQILDISMSPHCKFLKSYISIGDGIWQNLHQDSYYRMWRQIGKSKRSVRNKIKRFITTFESIKSNGFTGQIMITDKPLVANPYTKKYELYDGHHRAACCCVLGIKTVDAIILKVVPKNML
jgi:hypothetical protein